MATTDLCTAAQIASETKKTRTDDTWTTLVARVIAAATDAIEQHLGLHVISRGPLTEYHTIRDCRSHIRTRQRPIISVATIHEDIERAYGAATLLVAGTDYVVTKATGTIRRMSGSIEYPWMTGIRAVKVVYTAGYANLDSVPKRIVDICVDLSARMLREVDKETHGLSSVSDDQGSTTRFMPLGLTKGEELSLAPFCRVGYMSTVEED